MWILKLLTNFMVLVTWVLLVRLLSMGSRVGLRDTASRVFCTCADVTRSKSQALAILGSLYMHLDLSLTLPTEVQWLWLPVLAMSVRRGASVYVRFGQAAGHSSGATGTTAMV